MDHNRGIPLSRAERGEADTASQTQALLVHDSIQDRRGHRGANRAVAQSASSAHLPACDIAHDVMPKLAGKTFTISHRNEGPYQVLGNEQLSNNDKWRAARCINELHGTGRNGKPPYRRGEVLDIDKMLGKPKPKDDLSQRAVEPPPLVGTPRGPERTSVSDGRGSGEPRITAPGVVAAADVAVRSGAPVRSDATPPIPLEPSKRADITPREATDNRDNTRQIVDAFKAGDYGEATAKLKNLQDHTKSKDEWLTAIAKVNLALDMKNLGHDIGQIIGVDKDGHLLTAAENLAAIQWRGKDLQVEKQEKLPSNEIKAINRVPITDQIESVTQTNSDARIWAIKRTKLY